MPRLKHILGLAALVLFVGYFGVWRGFLLAYEQLGPVWGVVLGILAALGLIVIAVAGVIIIRTMRRVEGGDRPEDETNTPV